MKSVVFGLWVYIFLYSRVYLNTTGCPAWKLGLLQTAYYFTFCWPCIMLWFLVNDQRDAQFFTMYLFLFLLPTCTRHGHRHRVTVTRGCVDTICLSWWWARCTRNMLTVKNKNKYVVKNHFRPAHDTATDTEWQLPEVVLTQFVSADDEHDVLETCREFKIKIHSKELCVTLVICQEAYYYYYYYCCYYYYYFMFSVICYLCLPVVLFVTWLLTQHVNK
jgi:hypothetical protein